MSFLCCLNKKKITIGLIFASILGIGFYFWFSSSKPSLILWSWQRKDDLSFLKAKTPVAALIGTIYMNAQGFKIDPRTNPLSLSPHASILPVVRLEIDPQIPLGKKSLMSLVSAISSLAHPEKYGALQIDFDAKKSQRAFYKNLLSSLKKTHPHLKLSITALASWCVGDPWVDMLPIDYAVPMVFNLAEEREFIYKYLRHHKNWKAQKCKGYIGMNQKDLWELPPMPWYIFIFNDKAWSQEDYGLLKRSIRQ
jgi:hypothetical protein